MTGRTPGDGDSEDVRPPRPRKEKGATPARPKQVAVENWWTQRWISVLQRFGIGAGLERGLPYAREGRVLSLAIEPGLAKARVQGSRTKAYEVAIKVKTLSSNDKETILKAIGKHVRFVARLMAGEMPRDIETVFQEAGLTLFPAKLWDLTTECNCDDWSNPCKHTAAVYCTLGAEFDHDPFLVLLLRGLSRDELMAGLGAASSDQHNEPKPQAAPEPLQLSHDRFWGIPGAYLDGSPAAVEIPRSSALQLRRLGAFPLYRGESPFLDTLNPIYEAATARGLEILLGAENLVDRQRKPMDPQALEDQKEVIP